MKICGIDPGLTGGIAFMSGDVVYRTLEAARAPVLNITKGKSTKQFLNCWAIMDLFDKEKPDHVFIEKQQAMPKQGLSSTFSTGFGYGIYIGLLVASRVPYTEISPIKWKKDLQVPSDKDAARKRASEIFPSGSTELWPNKRDDGVAEAALIAFWGATVAPYKLDGATERVETIN